MELFLQKKSILEENVDFGRNSRALESYNSVNFEATENIDNFLELL